MEKILAVAIEAATKAGGMLKDNINGVREVAFKGKINLVTEMDRQSEREIVSVIRAVFPRHQILAEEDTRIETDSEFRWIIDPLDGTTNYAHGFPTFAVSIAVERAGEIAAGVVYDPMRDELFTAVRGNGAYLNGKTIHVSSTDVLINSLLATGFPYDRLTSRENNMNYFSALLLSSQEIRRCGSAALDLCSVASGRLDGYWELKLQPWDVAAGICIVSEAGGTVSTFAGSPSRISDSEILASNGKIHQAMLEIIYRAAHGS